MTAAEKRAELAAEAQRQARLVRENYDTNPRAYQAAETKLARLNEQIRALDADRATKALFEIEEWVQELIADRDGALDPDEVYWDTVHAYLDYSVDDPALRAEILRRTGVGERR